MPSESKFHVTGFPKADIICLSVHDPAGIAINFSEADMEYCKECEKKDAQLVRMAAALALYETALKRIKDYTTFVGKTNVETDVFHIAGDALKEVAAMRDETVSALGA